MIVTSATLDAITSAV